MPVIEGNTSGSIASVAYNIPSTIVSWFLSNKTGGSVTVSLIIVPDGGTPVTLWSGAIATATTEKSDIPVKLLAGYQIIITTTGSLDYYLSIE